MLYIGFIEIPFMLFSVFYVGESCQGWGREFESPFPLQILKNPDMMFRVFFRLYIA